MTKPGDELFVYTPEGEDYAGVKRDELRNKDERTHAERLRELQGDDGQHQGFRK